MTVRIPAINYMGTVSTVCFIFCHRQMEVVIHFVPVNVIENYSLWVYLSKVLLPVYVIGLVESGIINSS